MKIKINSDDGLPCNKSVFTENPNHYYFEPLLEKFSNK